MQQPLKTILPALALTAVTSVSSHADDLVYAFTAQLDVSSLGDAPLAGTIAEGLLNNNIDTLTGTFTYDPDAPADTGGGSLFQRRYLTGGFESDQFSDVPTSIVQLTVRNDIGSNMIDSLRVGQSYANDEIVDFTLADSTGTVYSDLSNPPSIDLNDFDDSTLQFGYFLGEGESSEFFVPAVYNITALTLVPEPTSLAMLGLAGLLVHRRRRTP